VGFRWGGAWLRAFWSRLHWKRSDLAVTGTFSVSISSKGTRVSWCGSNIQHAQYAFRMFNIHSDELFLPFLLPSWAGNTSTIKTIGPSGPRSSHEWITWRRSCALRITWSFPWVRSPGKKTQGNCDLGFLGRHSSHDLLFFWWKWGAQKFEASMTNHHGNYFSNILILDILNILSAICLYIIKCYYQLLKV
jgi:hypothetical protein